MVKVGTEQMFFIQRPILDTVLIEHSIPGDKDITIGRKGVVFATIHLPYGHVEDTSSCGLRQVWEDGVEVGEGDAAEFYLPAPYLYPCLHHDQLHRSIRHLALIPNEPHAFRHRPAAAFCANPNQYCNAFHLLTQSEQVLLRIS